MLQHKTVHATGYVTSYPSLGLGHFYLTGFFKIRQVIMHLDILCNLVSNIFQYQKTCFVVIKHNQIIGMQA